MMRVLVTGSSGFIGAHCLCRLLSEGCEIHAVNRAGQGENTARVAWHAGDLRETAQAVALIAKIRPTHLLHCAWVATPRVYGHSPENADWLQSSTALAFAFGAHGGVRFVGIGSSAEYDPGELPCVEDETPIRPAMIYGKCKAAFWLRGAGGRAASRILRGLGPRISSVWAGRSRPALSPDRAGVTARGKAGANNTRRPATRLHLCPGRSRSSCSLAVV
jgi:nucleoside-diphosphate-sugar epimerase